jgi:5,10-methylenetetrahydrofolate reductase
VNVADSPMARVRMSSLAAAVLIEREAGIETLLHFTTRDRNLMGIQADLLGAHALGLRSILALTGDPPGLGDYAQATAVYDLDAIGLLRLIQSLNAGEDAAGKPLAGATAFSASAGVDPGAEDFAETLRRTRLKLQAGACRLLTQPVYARDVLDRLLDALAPQVPVILGVMPLLTGRQADYLHHEVPGIRIPGPVREAMHRAGEHGERVGLELALELVAQVRDRIGGVYIVPSLGRMRGPLDLVRTWRRELRGAPADVEGIHGEG